MKFTICCLAFFILFAADVLGQKPTFPIVTKKAKVSILYNANGPQLDSVAAHLLAADIQRITGYLPSVDTAIEKAKANVIVIGSFESEHVKRIAGKSAFQNKLKNKWESFAWQVVNRPTSNILKALVIAGSDTRGTAYGVFSLAEKLGVSPWYWWADVPVQRKSELILEQQPFYSNEPSVKYRGIFINDEDWGLRPWAADTFEPDKKNIGPKTYAKVFELLLRLKANLLWPAMHPGTEPFYNDPANAAMASTYSIVIGSSHAEPMLRNNVGEWDEKKLGHFNYINNSKKVLQYWRERVQQTKGNDVVYTLGMRGVHDSGMEGVKTSKEAVPLLEKIFEDQRQLLQVQTGRSTASIPQVFTVYKEVLDIYDQGLKIPDDVTIVWPDDNYGYIQRLNNKAEKTRSGGSGVYYHASYWGRPHDYLWLSTTHPSLIRSEMMKAYETGADRLWVLNVGDIKPLEYNMQLFFDMAYNVKPFGKGEYTYQHLRQWTYTVFGDKDAPTITSTLWDYYTLAFERRPEFMGWSQTEPTTKTRLTTYNHFAFNDEAERRLDRYQRLQQTVEALQRKIQSHSKDAFYQLVYYPVVGAALMNKKFLYRDKAYAYAKQGRINAYDYLRLSGAAHDSIAMETEFYNNTLANGKWKGMMSMKPRELPVFQAPDLPIIKLERKIKWDAVPEGYDSTASSNNYVKKLPLFTDGLQQQYFVDVFLGDSIKLDWQVRVSHDWIRVSKASGQLLPEHGKNMQRLWISIDWNKRAKLEKAEGRLIIVADGKETSMAIDTYQSQHKAYQSYNGFVEADGYISMFAQHYTAKQTKNGQDWAIAKGLAHAGDALVATRNIFIPSDTANIKTENAFVAYDFYSNSTAAPVVSIYTLPTHPLNKNFSMRYAVSIDDGPIQIVDFKTFGRSEEWKQNVLRNSAIRTVRFRSLAPGKHQLKVYVIDPGVALDRILINFTQPQKSYSVVPETFKK